MRDMTPGGMRHAANRTEIRLRETDRSSRRIADVAAAAARGSVAYAERREPNVWLTDGTERVVISGLVVPVTGGRQYRVVARGLLWIDGATAHYGNLQVRYLLSADGAVADMTSPLLDLARVYAPPGGYGISGSCERTVPPIDTEQYGFLSVLLTGVVAGGRTGGVHGGGDGSAAARMWIFDDGAVESAGMVDEPVPMDPPPETP